MAISIKDIKQKQFSFQQSNGYNCDEVDDFLDALAAQMSELVRENMALKEAAKNAPTAPAAPVEAAEGEAYDEPSYFKNLEQAMRETLISSQRIADETIADARRKAQEILTGAQEQADGVTAEAQSQVEAAKTQVEELKAQIGTYRDQALESLDLQQAAIEEMRAALKKDA